MDSGEASSSSAVVETTSNIVEDEVGVSERVSSFGIEYADVLLQSAGYGDRWTASQLVVCQLKPLLIWTLQAVHQEPCRLRGGHHEKYKAAHEKRWLSWSSDERLCWKEDSCGTLHLKVATDVHRKQIE